MKTLLAALLMLPALSMAQDAPDAPPAAPSPPAPAAPAGPGQPGVPPADVSPDQPAPKPLPTPTPAPPIPTWQPKTGAILQVLDKVDGQSSTLTVADGQKQVYRNVTISVMSCYARPPDQPQDATAYLVIQDNSQTTPSFVGWMLQAEPSASMIEHPVYDVRVLGCT